MKHLLKLGDLSPEEILHVLDVADTLKRPGGQIGGFDLRQELHPHPHQL